MRFFNTQNNILGPREQEIEVHQSRKARIPFIGTYGVSSKLSENVRQARDFSVPAVAEPKLQDLGNIPRSKIFFHPRNLSQPSHSRNFSYSPLSSDEAQLPSLSPARPMTPTVIKAREREAITEEKTRMNKKNKENKEKSMRKKALKFFEARQAGKIHWAKSKGMKGFVKRTFGRKDLAQHKSPP